MPFREVQKHRLKPYVIDDNHWIGNDQFKIFLERDDATFFIQFQGGEFFDKSLEELKAGAKDYVLTARGMVFFPVIFVESPKPYAYRTGGGGTEEFDASLTLRVERIWIARMPKGERSYSDRAVQCDWDTPEDKRIAAAVQCKISFRELRSIDMTTAESTFLERALPIHQNEMHWFGYDETLYLSLKSTEDRLLSLREQFDQLIRSEAAILPSTWNAELQALPASTEAVKAEV